jgi:hypothetical protein
MEPLMVSGPVSVRRSITTEISDDILDDISRKNKKSITLQMSEDLQEQICGFVVERSEVGSETPSRRSSFASLFSRKSSLDVADGSVFPVDLKTPKPSGKRGSYCKQLFGFATTSVSYTKAK